MMMAAFRIPGAVGVKETVIVHVAPTASEEPQVLVSANSAALVPETMMLEIVCGLSPLVTVIVCDWLVVLRLCAGKTRPAGLRAKPARTLIFAMYASQFPPGTAWSGFASGKSFEHVCPAT